MDDLTPKMRDALFIAANTGEITGSRSGDLRYENVCAVRTAWALERRGLISRQWTGERFGSAIFHITAKGRELADSLSEDIEHAGYVERDSGGGYYVWCSHPDCDFDGHTAVAMEAEEWAANHDTPTKVASR